MNTTQYHPVNDALNADYLHSAFIIDKDGNEIRITRDMITECCSHIVSIEVVVPTKPERP